MIQQHLLRSISFGHATMPRHSRSSSRSGSRESRSRSRSQGSEIEGVRVYCGELPANCSERELEHIFKKFGPLVEVWMAKVPPCFAFIVFRDKEDAEEAIRAMNGRTICGRRVRVSIARPRVEARGPRRTVSQSNDGRCYQCGERGHLSRNCSLYRNRRNQSPRRRRRSSSDERSRSRSRSRDKRSRRSRSRNRSQEKEASGEGTSGRKSGHKSSKQSSSNQSRDKDAEDSKKERRRSGSTKAEDRESDNEATNWRVVSTAGDEEETT